MWSTLATTAPAKLPAYVIVNADTGPGTTDDSNYVAAITDAKAAGWTMLGYVDTAWATASISAVELQVDEWRSLYGVDDVFFDEVTGASANLSYYETLTRYVHSLGGIDILNPGCPPRPTSRPAWATASWSWKTPWPCSSPIRRRTTRRQKCRSATSSPRGRARPTCSRRWRR